MQWTGTTLKENKPRIIPVKFGQNPINDLGGDVVFEEIVYGQTHACRMNDRQNLVTKAHLVTM